MADSYDNIGYYRSSIIVSLVLFVKELFHLAHDLRILCLRVSLEQYPDLV